VRLGVGVAVMRPVVLRRVVPRRVVLLLVDPGVGVMRPVVRRRVVLLLVDPGVRVEDMRPAGRVVRRPVVPLRANLAVPDLMDRVVLGNRAVLMATALVDLVDLVAPAGQTALADPVGPMSRADPENRVGLVDPADLVVPVDPADLVVPDLMDRAAPVDRHLRHTSNTACTTGAGPRWAAPGTCRTGSARQITVHRLRRGSADSVGTMGLPPEPRRHSGTDHRPQEAGAGRRLLAAGTVDGMGRRATSVTHRPILGRSATTGTTRFRSLTHCLVGGASGSSVSGYRCTDLTRD
jgi:hypothetical protein